MLARLKTSISAPLTQAILLGVGILLGAELGHALSFRDSHFATFWPPSGIFLASLLMNERRRWPLLVVVALAVNYFSDTLLHQQPWYASAGFCLANMVEALVGAGLLSSVHALPFRFRSLRQVLDFIVCGAMIAPAAGAMIAACFVTMAFPDQTFGKVALTWWLADMVGVLIIGALILSVCTDRAPMVGQHALHAAVIALIAIVGTIWGVKAADVGGARITLAYPLLFLPLPAYMALVFGRKAACSMVLLVSVVAMYRTTHELGIIAQLCDTTLERALCLKLFLAVTSLSAFVVATIVEERRQAEEESQEHLQLLQGVLENATDLVFLKDLEGKYKLINTASAKALGRPAAEILGRTDEELFPHDFAAQLRRDDFITLEAGTEPHDFEVTWGEGAAQRVYMTTKNVYRDAAGSPQGVIGIAHDITNLRRTAAALGLSEQRFRALADNCPCGIYETDAKGNNIYLNAYCQQLLGITSEECINDGWTNFMHPDDADQVYERWQNLVEGRSSLFLSEHRFRRKDGSIIWVACHSAPIEQPDKGISGFIGCLFDITIRMEAETRLREANQSLESMVAERTRRLEEANSKLLERRGLLAHASRVSTMGEMAAGLAHELNQPLYAIHNYATGLKQRLKNGASSSDIQEVLSELGQESERASAIIKRMRQFVMRTPFKPERLCLNAIVREALLLTRYELRQKQIEIHVELPEALPPIHGDAIQIQQVLVNLLRNAVEALELVPVGERQLTVRVHHDERQLVVRVEDNGPGFSTEDSLRLFDAFFTTKEDGMGLGLPISRSIIEAHGGQLSARAGQQRGAAFEFTLALKNADSKSVAETLPVNPISPHLANAESDDLSKSEPVRVTG